jgi:hypothetical protein
LEVFGLTDANLSFLGRWTHLPSGAYALPILTLPGLVWAYRRASLPVVWFYVAVLAWWTVLQPSAWRFFELSPLFVGAIAGILLLVADCHPRGSRFAAPYRELGVLMMAGTLLVLSYYDANKQIFRTSRTFNIPPLQSEPVLGMWGAWVLLVAVATLAVGVLYLSAKLQPNPPEPTSSIVDRMVATARRQWLSVAFIVLVLFEIVWWIFFAPPLIPTILANVAMLALGFWLISTGMREDSGRMFAAGVGYLLLWAVIRYIDLFGDFGGMLGAAGMFLLCGLALFAVAWYWRHRKEAQHA